MALTQIAGDLWTAETDLRLPGGVILPIRCTVVRSQRGTTVVLSPIPFTDALADEVAAIGDVEALVAPSLLHHRFIGDWRRRFPSAKLYGAPGLDRKRGDLRFDGFLGVTVKDGSIGTSGALLDGELPYRMLGGVPKLNELVFFHPASGTLIACDLLFNIRHPRNFATKLILTLAGTRGRLAMSRELRWLTRDRVALRASVEGILEWPFSRLLVGHGDVDEGDGLHQSVRSALAWALRG